MSKPSEKKIVAALLERHGQTYAEECGITLEGDGGTPSPLFRMLCAAMLFSTRIRASIAVAAARALAEQGWTTAQKLAESTWEERAKTLNESGYARYDERTASMLGETVQLLLDRYSGDLRKLRAEAGHDPAQERKLLKQFKGLGDVGVDIFFREVQAVWDELFPFVDKKAQQGADKLGLPGDPEKLAGLVDQADFPRLVAALVRVSLEDDESEVLEAVE
jgi:hypothetical protein